MGRNLQHIHRIGELDRKVTLQSRTDTVDDYGGHVVSWADIDEVWAKVVWGPGSERELDSDVLRGVSDVTFVIRYRSDARDRRMRVVYDGSYFDVKGIAELGRKRFLELRCKLVE
ncbi:MAG: head-tail adaptor protein [Chloroflexi bacterium]|nr:MAG: head-tail adaptor protein [Chloroflexota bacterium]